MNSLRHMQHDARIIVIRGPLAHLDTAAMNPLDGYRP